MSQFRSSNEESAADRGSRVAYAQFVDKVTELLEQAEVPISLVVPDEFALLPHPGILRRLQWLVDYSILDARVSNSTVREVVTLRAENGALRLKMMQLERKAGGFDYLADKFKEAYWVGQYIDPAAFKLMIVSAQTPSPLEQRAIDEFNASSPRLSEDGED